jgi:hypothetical protein
MRPIVRTNEPYEAEGKWWAPGKARKKIPGILRFDPKSGSILSLSGSLTFKDTADLFEKSFVSGFPSYQVILGNTIDGTPITLFDNWIKKPSVDAENIFVNSVIVGKHCKNRSKQTFDAIRLRLFNLERWFEHHPFTSETKFHNDRELTATLKETCLSEIKGKLPAIDATIECVRGLAGTVEQYSASCEYQTELWIRFNKLQSSDACCQVSTQIQNLFTLLMGGPTSAYDFQLISDKSTRAAFLATWRPNVRQREIWNPQMPCAYSVIEKEFVGVLDGWLSMYKTLDLVISLLFEVLQVRGTVLEEKFFNLAQAVEGLCAESIPFSYETEDKIEQFKRAMIAAIPSDTNQGLKARTKSWLKYANNPSLQGYITRLFRSLDAKLKANVLGTWEEDKFIEYVKNTRNTITHPSNGSVWKYTTRDKFRDAMDRMKALLILKLLERAGVPLKVLQDRYDDVKGWTWG